MQTKRILYTNDQGGVSIIVPALDCTEEQALAAVPEGCSYEIVNLEDVPSDRTFRNAWFHDTTDTPQKVGVDISKAKEHCHAKRREARSTEFAPLDIKATIPSEAAQAESDRQKVREKYADIQSKIETASTAEELKSIVEVL